MDNVTDSSFLYWYLVTCKNAANIKRIHKSDIDTTQYEIHARLHARVRYVL